MRRISPIREIGHEERGIILIREAPALYQGLQEVPAPWYDAKKKSF
jgi:hypothetical protein